MSGLGPIPEEIRLKLYDLCGGVCEYCSSNDLENNPHHRPYRSQPGSSNTLRHLMWLCKRCHRWAHRRRNGYEEFQYEIFRDWYDQLPKNLMEYRNANNKLR